VGLVGSADDAVGQGELETGDQDLLDVGATDIGVGNLSDADDLDRAVPMFCPTPSLTTIREITRNTSSFKHKSPAKIQAKAILIQRNGAGKLSKFRQVLRITGSPSCPGSPECRFARFPGLPGATRRPPVPGTCGKYRFPGLSRAPGGTPRWCPFPHVVSIASARGRVRQRPPRAVVLWLCHRGSRNRSSRAGENGGKC
jgi:hypothetical protein